MSHFLTLVFTKKNGQSVEELLAPFDEDIVYDTRVEYTKEQAIAAIRKEFEECKNGDYAKYLADPKAYEESCHSDRREYIINYLRNEFPKRLNWTDEECYELMKDRFDEDMVDPNGDLLTTYNPNAKWALYGIGGRWNNCIKTLNGELVNEAYANEVDWKECMTPFAFITPMGEWHARDEAGCEKKEKKEKDWEREFKGFIDSLDENTMVTVVDCYI